MTDPEMIESWIDDELVESIERTDTDEDVFRFSVVFDDELELRQETEGGPLIVEAEYEFRDERRTALLADEDLNQTYVTNVVKILTDAPGFYQYFGPDGEVGVRIGNADVVRIHHRIYPDGATQQTLMASLIDIVVAMVSIRDLSDMLYGNFYD